MEKASSTFAAPSVDFPFVLESAVRLAVALLEIVSDTPLAQSLLWTKSRVYMRC